MNKLIIAATLLLAPLAVAPVIAQQVVPASFARGASSTALSGSIRGDRYVDYRISVRAGQMLKVNMQTLRGSPYFNILEPGSRDVAIFVGSTSGPDFEIRTSKNGAYTVRVYQMRATARRNELAVYRLSIGVQGRVNAMAHPMAPAHRSVDALVRGTPYHAVSTIRCRTMLGGAMGSCKAGVIRRPGSATVHLDTPDGGERTILFRDGRAVSSDADAQFRTERRGDMNIVRIGPAELYEIPDALPFGG